MAVNDEPVSETGTVTETPVSEETPGAEVDPGAETDPEASAEGGESADPAAEQPADGATDAQQTVEEVEEVVPEEDLEEFTEVPDSIALNGRVILLPDEPDPADPTQASGGGVLIGAEDGSFVPVDPASFGSALLADAQFSGRAQLTAAAKTAVGEALDEAGSLSAEDVLRAVTASLAETPEVLPVAGEVAAPLSDDTSAIDQETGELVAGAPSKKAHTADVVYFTSDNSSYNTRSFTQAQLTSLVTQAGSYWKTQSNGAVTGLSVSKFKTLDASYYPCSQSSLWSQASQSFSANANTYTNGHHLIVFVDSKYGCSQAGLAGIGTSIHSGGTIWVDLGAYGGTGTAANQSTVNKSLTALAHETGHNMSLGHAQSRVCTGTTTDARTAWYADEQNPSVLKVRKPSGTPCADAEYGDSWSLMGAGSDSTSKPVSLGVAQRGALAVNPSGSIKVVQASGGRKQVFTLNALGNNSGLRGLKITNPEGEDFYVEYRAALGQDSQGLVDRSYGLSYDGSSYFSKGVQITKSYPTAKALWSDGKWRSYGVKRSTAITFYKTSGDYSGYKHINRLGGVVSTPIDSVARINVLSVSGSTAKVQVEFSPFIDVSYSHKFAKEINWMADAGISTGISAGGNLKKYDPGASVTREAMAAFLYRMKGASYTPPKTSPFADVKTSHKFYKQIAWMYKAGISTGTVKNGKRYYEPSKDVSREAMAAFLYRMKGASYTPPKTSP
ncbi:MAG: S-layer homology domain-containing protein, partial [Leucobacter sp.]